jgi:hypothetical protein
VPATADPGERASDQRDQISEFAFLLGEIMKISREPMLSG